jgi:hypothetical protein
MRRLALSLVVVLALSLGYWYYNQAQSKKVSSTSEPSLSNLQSGSVKVESDMDVASSDTVVHESDKLSPSPQPQKNLQQSPQGGLGLQEQVASADLDEFLSSEDPPMRLIQPRSYSEDEVKTLKMIDTYLRDALQGGSALPNVLYTQSITEFLLSHTISGKRLKDLVKLTDTGLIADAWDRGVCFHVVNSKEIEVISLGKDGIRGSDDDIKLGHASSPKKGLGGGSYLKKTNYPHLMR